MSPDDVVSAAEKAGKGIDQTHERAQQCMEESDYFTAFELAILCFGHVLDAFQYTDDSSGDIEYTIEESLALIEQTIDESADMWDKTQYDEVFTLVSVEEAMNTDSNIADVFSSFQHYAVIRKFKEVLKSL